MMGVYLPLAEMAPSLPLLLALGAVGGFLSGMFGVGGAFIVTPLLIFAGIPPAIAVGAQAAQLAGTGLSGAISKARKRQLDPRMGLTLAGGSLFGVALGAVVFQHLRHAGQIDLTINLGYALILSAVGGLMLRETLGGALGASKNSAEQISTPWGAGWIWAIDFPASGLRLGILSPLLIGCGCGILTVLFGVGSGFVLVPAMLYLLRMPPALVAGTSMLQILFASACAAVTQSVLNHNVDLVLATILLLGSLAGLRAGTRAAARISPARARLLLAALILAGAGKLWLDLLVTPHEIFSLVPGGL